MNHYLDPDTLSDFADQRAAIDDAQTRADAYARAELDPAAARLSALQEGRSRLGEPPMPDAFTTAAEWSEARDQHTFAASRYARDIAAAEQQMTALHEEHHRLLAEVAPLVEGYRRAVFVALDAAVTRKAAEAAEIAHVRQSLLTRIAPDEWGRFAPQARGDRTTYQVKSSGFPEISFFDARVQGDGFTPDKSAALAEELALF